jgi:hypothetical protein
MSFQPNEPVKPSISSNDEMWKFIQDNDKLLKKVQDLYLREKNKEYQILYSQYVNFNSLPEKEQVALWLSNFFNSSSCIIIDNKLYFTKKSNYLSSQHMSIPIIKGKINLTYHQYLDIYDNYIARYQLITTLFDDKDQEIKLTDDDEENLNHVMSDRLECVKKNVNEHHWDYVNDDDKYSEHYIFEEEEELNIVETININMYFKNILEDNTVSDVTKSLLIKSSQNTIK